MSDKQVPTRRDLREARGYLTDLFDSAPDMPSEATADFLLEHAQQVKVQRSGDMLVLYFDLNEEPAAETETTTPALTVVS